MPYYFEITTQDHDPKRFDGNILLKQRILRQWFTRLEDARWARNEALKVNDARELSNIICAHHLPLRSRASGEVIQGKGPNRSKPSTNT